MFNFFRNILNKHEEKEILKQKNSYNVKYEDGYEDYKELHDQDGIWEEEDDEEEFDGVIL